MQKNDRIAAPPCHSENTWFRGWNTPDPFLHGNSFSQVVLFNMTGAIKNTKDVNEELNTTCHVIYILACHGHPRKREAEKGGKNKSLFLQWQPVYKVDPSINSQGGRSFRCAINKIHFSVLAFTWNSLFFVYRPCGLGCRRLFLQHVCWNQITQLMGL